VFSGSPVWVAAVLVAVLFFGGGQFGFLSARRSSLNAAESTAFGVVQTTAFTLLSLLLAFSFSLALSRYDARRELVTKEANAIGTAVLRADLLEPAARVRERALLEDYLDARMTYLSSSDENARAATETRTAELQQRMWDVAATEVHRDARSTATPLFVTALNDVFDLSLMQRAAQRAHVPDLIAYILIVLVLIAGTLFGTTWKTWRSTLLAAIALAVMFGAVFGAVIDLDQPQAGTIRVDLSALAADKALFTETK
jgi:hypothetical protein